MIVPVNVARTDLLIALYVLSGYDESTDFVNNLC